MKDITREASMQASKGFRDLKYKKFGPFLYSYSENIDGLKSSSIAFAIFGMMFTFQFTRQ